MFESRIGIRTLANVVFNQLSARKVETVKRPGRYTDGLGLCLIVDAEGHKRWVLRVTVNGRRRDMGLGSALEVGLAEAREQRDQIRRAIRDGRDPIADRKRETSPTFAAFARKLHEAIKGDFKNQKHAAQWLSTLETYAFPTLGARQVHEVDPTAIKDALERIWAEKPETARRVKQRIARVMGAAIAEGLHPGPNPADDAATGLSKKRPKANGFAAMPYAEVPAFFASLDATGMHPASRLAFRLLILTAKRTGEIIGARWDEIDRERVLWTIPAERMKTGVAHDVPLSPAVLAVLDEAAALYGAEGLVFPSQKRDRPLSNMVFLKALQRLDVPFTAHGFRSSFRDWCEERTAYSYAAKEAALAHVVTSKVEAAYRRTTLLDERRALLADWAAFVTGAGA